MISRDDKYLLCKRPAHKNHGGLWEFPGGKLEPGESFTAAARRELKEELGLDAVFVGSILYSTIDESSSLEILFVPVGVEGEPVLYEHQSCKWVSAEELKNLSLAPSDLAFAKTLTD